MGRRVQAIVVGSRSAAAVAAGGGGRGHRGTTRGRSHLVGHVVLAGVGVVALNAPSDKNMY